jgi:hypothetical protein
MARVTAREEEGNINVDEATAAAFRKCRREGVDDSSPCMLFKAIVRRLCAFFLSLIIQA